MRNSAYKKLFHCWTSYEQKLVFLDNPWQSILQKVRKLRQRQTRAVNFYISFCVSFDYQYQNLISGGETGRQPVSTTNSKLLLSFLNFLRYYVLSCSAICNVTLIKNFLYQRSSPILLAVNQTSTETQKIFKIQPGLQVQNKLRDSFSKAHLYTPIALEIYLT